MTSGAKRGKQRNSTTCLPACPPSILPSTSSKPGLATHHTVSAAPCPLRPSEKGTAAASEIIKLLRPTTRVSLQKLRERTTKAKSLPWAISGRPVAIIRLLVSRTTYYLSLAPSLPPFPPACRRAACCSVCLVSRPLPFPFCGHHDRPTNRSLAGSARLPSYSFRSLQCRPSHETSGPHCPRLRRPRHALSGPDRACSGQAGQFWVGEMIAAPFLPTTRHEVIISRPSARRVTKRVERLRVAVVSFRTLPMVPSRFPFRPGIAR